LPNIAAVLAGEVSGVGGGGMGHNTMHFMLPARLHFPKEHSKYSCLLFKHQAQVVQKLDSAIHQINHYPVDKY